MAMSSRFYSDSRWQQRRRGGGEPDDVVVVGDTLQILSPLPLIVQPSPSLSTLRRRPVSLDSSSLRRASMMLVKTCHEPRTNSEWLVLFNTPSPVLLRHISFKTLNYVSLSAAEYSTLLRSEWDFSEALRHLRFLNSWGHESIALIPSRALRLPQLMGPNDRIV